MKGRRWNSNRFHILPEVTYLVNNINWQSCVPPTPDCCSHRQPVSALNFLSAVISTSLKHVLRSLEPLCGCCACTSGDLDSLSTLFCVELYCLDPGSSFPSLIYFLIFEKSFFWELLENGCGRACKSLCSGFILD